MTAVSWYPNRQGRRNRGGGTELPNGVKVAVSDNSQKCQKLTNMGLTSGLQLFLMYFI